LSDARHWLSAVRWLRVSSFPRTPKIWSWDGSTLSQVVYQTEPRWRARDIVALSVAAWFLRERGSETLDGILRSSLGIN
jgi:hypothetical protein